MLVDGTVSVDGDQQAARALVGAAMPHAALVSMSKARSAERTVLSCSEYTHVRQLTLFKVNSKKKKLSLTLFKPFTYHSKKVFFILLIIMLTSYFRVSICMASIVYLSQM